MAQIIFIKPILLIKEILQPSSSRSPIKDDMRYKTEYLKMYWVRTMEKWILKIIYMQSNPTEIKF